MNQSIDGFTPFRPIVGSAHDRPGQEWSASLAQHLAGKEFGIWAIRANGFRIKQVDQVAMGELE